LDQKVKGQGHDAKKVPAWVIAFLSVSSGTYYTLSAKSHTAASLNIAALILSRSLSGPSVSSPAISAMTTTTTQTPGVVVDTRPSDSLCRPPPGPPPQHRVFVRVYRARDRRSRSQRRADRTNYDIEINLVVTNADKPAVVYSYSVVGHKVYGSHTGAAVAGNDKSYCRSDISLYNQRPSK